MVLIESVCLLTALGLYAAAFIAAAAAISFKESWARALTPLLGLAWVLQTVALAWRGIVQFSPPFITYFESVAFGCWLAAGGYLLFARRLPAAVGATVSLINFLLLGSAALAPRPLTPLPPALQSWWLLFHVLFALLTFGALVVGAGAAAALLLPSRVVQDRERLGRWLVPCLSFAFMSQLAMITSGAIWAHKAWGRYWGWDPIETFSLLTWLVYGVALHAHYTYGWKGPRLAWSLVTGLVLAIYGIWGVPYFSKSVHLYEVQ